MSKIKIGSIFGRNIYIGNPSQLKDGEYYIQTSGKIPTGLYIKSTNDLIPVCNCNKEEKELNLENIELFKDFHGDKVVITPKEGYDAIGSVTVKKPKLEEKDTVTITKNGITEIKVGRGYDGLDDVTVIVNVENNE